MYRSHVGMSCNGAIRLGCRVTCDGFTDGYTYRVQTHVHDDHMRHFDTSKGFQTIIMSDATRSLLELTHSDMPYRSNVMSLPIGGTYRNSVIEIELKSSSHMLGAVQVAVTTESGNRIGYSGDFSWPLDDVIEVESLVVDSTYGSPSSVRRYSQQDANDRFRDIVVEKIVSGPIVVRGRRGTLHRALELLEGLVQHPVVAARRKIAEAKVYERYGYCFCPMLELESPEARRLRRDGSYIELHYLGEQMLFYRGDLTFIDLTADWVHGEEPFLQTSESSYKIAVSDHADFNETLEYVRQTGAKYVLTDATRGNHASELAIAITSRLGIRAEPARPIRSRAWGI